MPVMKERWIKIKYPYFFGKGILSFVFFGKRSIYYISEVRKRNTFSGYFIYRCMEAHYEKENHEKDHQHTASSRWERWKGEIHSPFQIQPDRQLCQIRRCPRYFPRSVPSRLSHRLCGVRYPGRQV